MQAILAATAQLDVGMAILLSLVVNAVLLAVLVAAGEAIARVWRHRPVVVPPPALSHFEVVLAAVTVAVNAGVMVAGWLLFRHGILRVDGTSDVTQWIVDLVVLTVVMDVAMYVLHRAAHHPVAFRLVHEIHHRYDQPRPLTLFVLHPLEVAGFGALWIAVLCIAPFSLGGMLLYLTLNSVFGMFGHVGVEPVPAAWGRLPLGTSTFHARHHQRPDSNFGFYTSIWDRLFGSLDPSYIATFGQPPTKDVSARERTV